MSLIKSSLTHGVRTLLTEIPCVILAAARKSDIKAADKAKEKYNETVDKVGEEEFKIMKEFRANVIQHNKTDFLDNIKSVYDYEPYKIKKEKEELIMEYAIEKALREYLNTLLKISGHSAPEKEILADEELFEILFLKDPWFLDELLNRLGLSFDELTDFFHKSNKISSYVVETCFKKLAVNGIFHKIPIAKTIRFYLYSNT